MRLIAKTLSAALALTLLASAAGAQPPLRPERPPLPAVTAADCEAPARRDALLADPERTLESITLYPRALAQYSESLTHWHEAKLAGTGRWSQADRRSFGEALLASPAFTAEVEAGFGLIGDLMEALQTLGDEGRPARDRCLGLVATEAVFDRIGASAQRQWRIIDQAFAAEAARLGLSLD